MRLPNHPTVVRIKKLTSFGAVGSSAAHTWRTMPVPHADETRTHLNEDWRDANSPKALRAAMEERLVLAEQWSERPVIAIEYLVTANHAAFQENGGPVAWRPYFEDSLAWLEKHHGRENVVAVNIQLDESAPHMVAYVVPLVSREARERTRSVFGEKDPETGRQTRVKHTETVPAHVSLSADHYVGTREKLSRMQTNFAAEVGERHGLRRGIERSALNHVNLKQYHDALMRGIQQRLEISPEILKRQGGILSKETPEQAANRVAEVLQEQMGVLAAQAATARLDRQRAEEWEQTAVNAQADRHRAQKALCKTQEDLEGLVGGLTQGEREKVCEYRQKCLAKRAEAKKKRKAEQVSQHTKQLVADVRSMSPREVAELPEADRRALWRELVRRDDLERELNRLMDSGLFEVNGTPLPNRQAGGATREIARNPMGQPTPSPFRGPNR